MKIRTMPASSQLTQKLDAQSNGRSFAFFYVTNQCNLTCRHCSFQSSSEQTGTHMDTNITVSTLGELKGIHDITLTGGEPLLHPDFAEILSAACRNAGLVYVMTNGIELVSKESLRLLAKKNDLAGLKRRLRKALKEFPDNTHLFLPLDSFHLRAFRPFTFLLSGLAELAREFNSKPDRPGIGFLCNEVSSQKSEQLTARFKVRQYAHIGTAMFSPWRDEKDIRRWFFSHQLNQVPFPGGIYMNYKGVYLNEAALLMDLRQGLETPLKLGGLDTGGTSNQLQALYSKGFKKLVMKGRL